MQPAQYGLRAAFDAIDFANPRWTDFAHVDGRWAQKDPRTNLVDQPVSLVRWTEEVTAMAQWHPDATFVEVGPGNVLVGLVKKIAPAVKTMTCGTTAEVNQLLEMVS